MVRLSSYPGKGSAVKLSAANERLQGDQCHPAHPADEHTEPHTGLRAMHKDSGMPGFYMLRALLHRHICHRGSAGKLAVLAACQRQAAFPLADHLPKMRAAYGNT